MSEGTLERDDLLIQDEMQSSSEAAAVISRRASVPTLVAVFVLAAVGLVSVVSGHSGGGAIAQARLSRTLLDIERSSKHTTAANASSNGSSNASSNSSKLLSANSSKPSLRAAAAKKNISSSAKCSWTELPQYDFPEVADVRTVSAKSWSEIDDAKRIAEEEGYAGFSLHGGTAYMKDGHLSPRSRDNLLWMGEEYDVVFFLCELMSDVQDEIEGMESNLIDAMYKQTLAETEGKWVVVHALPRIEGDGIALPDQEKAETRDDMKVMCVSNPDCVGFAYFPETKRWFPKRKGTGFSANRAVYHQKEGQAWEWHYLTSRAGEYGGPASVKSKRKDADGLLKIHLS